MRHFVQPPPGHLEDCMTQLEPFIHGGHHGEHTLPVLVRAALAHVQIAMIYPFLDGNGRLDWLLIVLMLIEAGVLQQPGLYMSLFFKQHRSRYYELLDLLRPQRDWEAWLAWGLAQAAAHKQLKQLKELLGMSFPTVSKATETLVGLGIAREITGGGAIGCSPTTPTWRS
jgi:Fic family protein